MTPLVVAVVAALVAGLLGTLVPRGIARLPEPAPRAAERDEPGEPDEPPKQLYAAIGATSGLALRCASAAGAAGGLVALAVGPDPVLVGLVPLIVVGVLLAVVDWRTRLLPAIVVVPATAVAILLGLVGWAATGDGADLLRAVIGLVLARSFYWVLWFVRSAGMGFGDVRLAALLGFALGHLGWAELAVGGYAGFLVFGLPGLVLAVVRRDRSVLRRAYPFGPFMLVGALIGVLLGDPVAGLLGGRG